MIRIAYSVLAVCLLLGCGGNKAPQAGYSDKRLVSFSPALTEFLFALELGENVVGVSRYCKYPEAAAELPKVGGFLDPDLEALIRLNPGCAVVQKSSGNFTENLVKLGVPVLEVPLSTLDDVLAASSIIGKALNREPQGRELHENLSAGLEALDGVWEKSRPRVLTVVWREVGGGKIRQLTAAGNDGLYSALIAKMGGVPVPESSPVPYPLLSAESVLKLNPDLIVEIMPDSAIPAETVRNDWEKTLPDLPAVTSGRIYQATADYASIPAPRFIRLGEDLVQFMAEE